ncbi:MAG: helix-hairpin-helix domain-containing protein [Deltaproteobacteria bacterium]|nr:helix-hairpin-helix domain-containing protein [Deltaproteobacteria bacterium]
MTGATSRYLVLALMLLSLFSLHQCLDHRNETQEFSPLPATSFLLGQKIPINTADPKMLEALPGIGPKLAQRIVEDRRMNGPFKNEKELLRVPGLGPKKVEAIRSLIDF